MGGRYFVYSLKNGKWKYLVEPISTHCNTCEEDLKPIKKDPNVDGNVIIKYTEMFEVGYFILKSKSIKVD